MQLMQTKSQLIICNVERHLDYDGVSASSNGNKNDENEPELNQNWRN